MVFAYKELMDLMNIKIFVDTDSDIRLARRLKRDMQNRGRTIESVIEQYHKFVKPAYDYHIAPSMVMADIIVPNGTLKKIIKIIRFLLTLTFKNIKIALLLI